MIITIGSSIRDHMTTPISSDCVTNDDNVVVNCVSTQPLTLLAPVMDYSTC